MHLKRWLKTRKSKRFNQMRTATTKMLVRKSYIPSCRNPTLIFCQIQTIIGHFANRVGNTKKKDKVTTKSGPPTCYSQTFNQLMLSRRRSRPRDCRELVLWTEASNSTIFLGWVRILVMSNLVSWKFITLHYSTKNKTIEIVSLNRNSMPFC